MGEKALISTVEYLRSGFENPEPDYVDGELVKRCAPSYLHGRTQVRLSDAFKSWEDRRQLFRASEIRLCIAPGCFRVVDFAVFSAEQDGLSPLDSPYAVVEISSPDDLYHDLMRKLSDYEQAGVGFIFVASPTAKRLSRYHRSDLLAVSAIELPEFQAVVPASSIFG